MIISFISLALRQCRLKEHSFLLEIATYRDHAPLFNKSQVYRCFDVELSANATGVCDGRVLLRGSDHVARDQFGDSAGEEGTSGCPSNYAVISKSLGFIFPPKSLTFIF